MSISLHGNYYSTRCDWLRKGTLLGIFLTFSFIIFKQYGLDCHFVPATKSMTGLIVKNQIGITSKKIYHFVHQIEVSTVFGDGCWHPESILTLTVFQSRRFFTLARPYIKYMLHSLQIFRHISCMVSILTI